MLGREMLGEEPVVQTKKKKGLFSRRK
jgi:hypothetical protein